jgi:hypothetical protein
LHKADYGALLLAFFAYLAFIAFVACLALFFASYLVFRLRLNIRLNMPCFYCFAAKQALLLSPKACYARLAAHGGKYKRWATPGLRRFASLRRRLASSPPLHACLASHGGKQEAKQSGDKNKARLI